MFTGPAGRYVINVHNVPKRNHSGRVTNHGYGVGTVTLWYVMHIDYVPGKKCLFMRVPEDLVTLLPHFRQRAWGEKFFILEDMSWTYMQT